MPLFEHETPGDHQGRILDRMSTSLQTGGQLHQRPGRAAGV